MDTELLLYYLYAFAIGMCLILIGSLISLFSAFRYSVLLGILNLFFMPFPYMIMFVVHFKRMGKIPGLLIIIGSALVAFVWYLGGDDIQKVYLAQYEEILSHMSGK